MIRYTVDELHRTITAAFTPASGNWTDSDVWEIGLYNNLANLSPELDMKSGAIYYAVKELQGSYTAKAKCHPDDEWDEEYGKALAKKRLLEKWNKTKKRSIEIIIGWHDDMLRPLRAELARLDNIVPKKGEKE